MRASREVSLALSLLEKGLNHCEISRRTGIPRGTVCDWAAGKLPRGRRGAEGGCPACGAEAHDPGALPQAAYAYLLGLYLGDGCISSHRRAVFKLRVFVDARHPGIVAECAAAMRAVIPESKASTQVKRWRGPDGPHDSCIEVHSYSKQWPCLFPQHGPGPKHLRRIELTHWPQGWRRIPRRVRRPEDAVRPAPATAAPRRPRPGAGRARPAPRPPRSRPG